MIAVNLIRQYKICPRIIYYKLLTNIKPIYPRHVSLGLDYHLLQKKLSKDRKFLKLKIKYEESLEDENLGLIGKCDLFFLTKYNIIPVEFKSYSSDKPSLSHILQLYGYGFLLEKKYNKKFEYGFIIFENNMKFHKVKLKDKYKKEFYKVLDEINNIKKNASFPESNASDSQCLQCEYLNFYDDRF